MGVIRFAYLTATHNDMPFLPECVESIQNQQLGDPDGHEIQVQHIVVNDASTDETADYLEEVEAHDHERFADELDQRVLVVNLEENVGQARALDIGHVAMNGRIVRLSRRGIPAITTMPHYVSALDGDDMLPLNAAQLYTRACADRLKQGSRHPAMMFGLATIIDQHGNELPDVPQAQGYNEVPATENVWELCRRMQECNHIPGYAAFEYPFLFTNYDLAIARKFRCFDWAIARAALTAIAVSERWELCMIHEPVYTYRIHPGQSSAHESADGTWEREGQLMNEDPHLNPFHPDHSKILDGKLIVDALESLPVKGPRSICRRA